MGSDLSLDISNGGLLYQVFYTAAFLVAYAILVYEGYRRKFPLVAWILILASIRLAVVTGTRLFAWTPEEWQFITDNHVLLPSARKTMFGGLAMGIAAYLIVSRIMRFRHNPWDTVAYAFPAAVAVQSLGCFFYGCCFGSPSDLPWSVSYPVMSLAHFHQFESGLITYGNSLSLPVHPVQLYQSAGALTVILLVFMFRNRWKAGGSLLLSSVVFFCAIRFIIEFFRDPLSNKTGGEFLLGLKIVQWQYLVFGLLMLFWLIWRERRWRPVFIREYSPAVSLNMRLGILLALLMIFIAIRDWFTLPEAIALNMALLPAVILTGVEVYRKFSVLRLRWVYASLLIMPLVLMSQTLPQTQNDSTSVKKYSTFHTVGGGFSTGNYTTERADWTGSGCDAVVERRYYQQKHTSGTLGYMYTRKTQGSDDALSLGGNITAGRFLEENVTLGGGSKETLIDLYTFARYDSKWIGAGAGLHFGNLIYNRGDRSGVITDISSSYFRRFALPALSVRVGPEKIFFTDIHFSDHFPSSAPGLMLTAGVGTGFGLETGFKLRGGVSILNENAWYFSAYLPLADRLVIEPLFWFTGKIDPEYPTDAPETQFMLGVSYRFGHK